MAKVTIGVSVIGKQEAIADLAAVSRARARLETESVVQLRAAATARLGILRAEAAETKSIMRDVETSRRRSDEARSRGAGRSAGRGDGPGALAIGAAVAGFTGALNLASAGLKQFGSFVVNDAIKPFMRLQTVAQQVANASGGKVSQNDVLGAARSVSLKNNIDPQELIKAAGTFQDLTGESKIGFDLLNTLGTLGKARGFDVQQLAGMAGSLYKPGMEAKDVEKILLSMLAQGDVGSITLGEMSKLGGKITAPAASFAGDYSTRIATSGALLQSARKGFGSTDETATGLASFVTDMMKSGKRFSATAIKKDASGVEQIVDPAKLIADIYRKTGGAASQLAAARLSEPTTKLIGSYSETYGEAFKKAKDEGASDTQAKNKAAAAVEDFIKSFVTANTSMEDESAKRDEVMATSAERFDSVLNKVKDRLATGLAPTVERLADVLELHGDEIATALSILADATATVAEGIVGALEFLHVLKTPAEGAVKRIAVDRGRDTELSEREGEKGYWRKGAKGKFEFISSQEKPMDRSQGKWITVGKSFTPVWVSNEQAKADEEAAAKRRKAVVPDKGAGPEEAKGGKGGAQDVEADAERLGFSMKKLQQQMEELTNAVDGLGKAQARQATK